MLKRILVDLSDTQRSSGIVHQAVSLAEKHQSELTVLVEPAEAEIESSTPLPGIAAAGWARVLHRQQLVESREKVGVALENLQRLCGVKNVPYSIRERTGDPFQSTIELFRFHDLFVCGTNACFDAASLEPGCEELIRLVEQGVRPLLAVPDDNRTVRKVVVAMSAAVDSSRTLKHFIHLDAWPGASMKIVAFDGEPEPQLLLSEAVAYVRQYGIEAEHEILTGRMSQELLPHAVDIGADMVVLGNSDHSRLARWFFGGAVMEIIRESDRLLFLCR